MLLNQLHRSHKLFCGDTLNPRIENRPCVIAFVSPHDANYELRQFSNYDIDLSDYLISPILGYMSCVDPVWEIAELYGRLALPQFEQSLNLCNAQFLLPDDFRGLLVQVYRTIAPERVYNDLMNKYQARFGMKPFLNVFDS